MSALPPKADIRPGAQNVRYVPKADIQSSLVRFTSKLSRRISIVCCLARQPQLGSTYSSARMACLCAVRALCLRARKHTDDPNEISQSNLSQIKPLKAIRR